MKDLDFTKVRVYSINNRKSKVRVSEFARTARPRDSFLKFYDGLPDILAVKSFKAVVGALVSARQRSKMIIFMLGAHVIKCGLSPLIIDLMERGFIKAVALNGAGVIHDVEVAMVGRTSEDVGEGILKGSFGMAREPAEFINKNINIDCRSGFSAEGAGIGGVIGRKVLEARLKFRDMSILAQGYKLKIPVSSHIAIGTDIIHQHPSADGAAIGEGTMADFKRFANSVSRLGGGGVVVNFGSAVILPEVFLKAINLSRNLGSQVKGFTAANFDMYTHYRSSQNILLRPTQKGFGRGYNIIGHHEIMLPLLYRALIEKK